MVKQEVKKKGTPRVFTVVMAVVLVMSLFLVGCSGGSDTKEDESNGDADVAMKVGLFSGSYLSVPVLVAKELGYFEEEGVNVEWESMQTDGTVAVSTGDLDMYCTGYNGALAAIAEGETGIKIVGGEMSEGCDYLVNEDYKGKLEKPQDFEGLKIAACTGDPGLYMTQVVLKENDVNAEFIELGSIEESIVALQKGEVDMSIVCGAASYDAISDGYKVLAKVSDITGTFPCCRLQANSTFIEENSDQLDKFMKAALRGYETYVNDPDKTSEILAGISSQDPENVKAKMYGTDAYDTPMKVSIDPEADAIINANEKFVKAGSVPESDYEVKDFIYVDSYENALQSLIGEDGDNELWAKLMKEFKENNKSVL